MRDRDIDDASPISAEEVGRLARERVAEYLAPTGFDPPRLLERVERFATALALWGRRINLTAVPDDPAELTFHIVDSLAPLLIATRPEGSVLTSCSLLAGLCSTLAAGRASPG